MAATTIAAVAAVAATIAATIASAVAAMALVATTVATVAAVAATTVAGAMATAATAATMAKGQRFAVTAHEGNANQREEQSQTQHNNTIHSQILQLLTGTVSENNLIAVNSDEFHHGGRRPSDATRPGLCEHVTSLHFPEAKIPVVKIYGLRRL